MRIREEGGVIRIAAAAKLNLFLEVGPPRDDGFHPIDSVFQEISIADDLEFSRLPAGRLELVEEGEAFGQENIVLRAARLLQAKFGSRTLGARIRVRKTIPHGAGLGGGSSDAAAALVGLSRLWGLGLGREALLELAGELGSDVPFFLYGGTARCRGRGEIVTPLSPAGTQLDAFRYVVVAPGVQVPTARIYHELDGLGAWGSLTVRSPLDSMNAASILEELASGKLIFNRLQEVACTVFPELRRIVASLEKEPFLRVSMSGSGSAIFGLMARADDLERRARNVKDRLERELGRIFPGLRVFAARALPAAGGSEADT